jgi:hypothetical protein
MLDVLQIIGVIVAIIAALASAYAVFSSELNRRLEARRLRVERVLDAALVLTEAAVRTQEAQGQGAAFDIARRRLWGELQVVGIKGFESTELMLRSTLKPGEVVGQSEAAIPEIGARLDELAPHPLFRRWIKRKSATSGKWAGE